MNNFSDKLMLWVAETMGTAQTLFKVFKNLIKYGPTFANSSVVVEKNIFKKAKIVIFCYIFSYFNNICYIFYL